VRWEKRETRRAQRAVRVCSLTRARSLPPAFTPPRQCRDSRWTCADGALPALVVNTKKSETGRGRRPRRGNNEQTVCRSRRARGPRRRARVRQRGVRQGARAAAAAVLQVQGRGLLLQGVPGGRPGRPRCAQRAVRVCSLTRARSLPPCLHPPATRLPRGRPGTSTSAVRRGRARRRRSSGAPRGGEREQRHRARRRG